MTDEVCLSRRHHKLAPTAARASTASDSPSSSPFEDAVFERGDDGVVDVALAADRRHLRKWLPMIASMFAAETATRSALPVVPICRGRALLILPPNQRHISRYPAHSRGAYRDRHGRWAGCGGRGGAFDERRLSGRRRRVVLTPRRWRQVLEKQASQGRRWQESPVAGESAQETVKTIAWGMPGDSGVT